MYSLDNILQKIRTDITGPLLRKEELPFYDLQLRKAKIEAELNFILETKKFQKLKTTEVMTYSIEVAFILYIVPVELIALVENRKDVPKLWRYYIKDFPQLEFDGDVLKFYKAFSSN